MTGAADAKYNRKEEQATVTTMTTIVKVVKFIKFIIIKPEF